MSNAPKIVMASGEEVQPMKFALGDIVHIKSQNIEDPAFTVIGVHPPSDGKYAMYTCLLVAHDGSNVSACDVPEFALVGVDE